MKYSDADKKTLGLWECEAKECHWWFPFDGICICSERPTRLLLDQQGRLHSELLPAIEYSDGWTIHALSGVRVEETLWKEIVSGDMTFKQVMAIQNVERRMTALKFNREAMLDKKDLLSESKRGNELYGVKGIFPDFPVAYFLKFQCPSTGRVYIEGVEPEVGKLKDADLAQAKALGLTKEDYAALTVET